MKSFFKTLLASTLGVIIGSVVLMVLSIIIFAGIISAMGSSETYNLKDDRADVIVPAGRIFLDVAKQMKCEKIFVPNISLADSIIDGLYRELRDKE